MMEIANKQYCIKIFSILSYNYIFLLCLNSVQVEALDCYSCVDQVCQRTSAINRTTTCDTTGCVTVFEQYVPIFKGCYSSLSTENKAICDNSTNLSCYKCSEDKCNHMGREDHKCVQCSQAISSDCLDNPHNQTLVRCEAPRTDTAYCYSKVNSTYGALERGCANTNADLKICEESKGKCSLCLVTGDLGCNTVEIPTGRRKCYYCKGTRDECKNLTLTHTSISKYCTNITDECVSFNKDGIITQSCNDNQFTTEYCNQNEKHCLKCNATNCNALIPNGSDQILFSPILCVLLLISLVVAKIIQ